VERTEFIAPEDAQLVAEMLEGYRQERKDLLEAIRAGKIAESKIEQVEDDIRFWESVQIMPDLLPGSSE